MTLPWGFLTCSGNVQKPSEARPSDAYSYSGTSAKEERDWAIQNIHICRGKEGRGRKEQRRHSKDALHLSESEADAGEKSGKAEEETRQK